MKVAANIGECVGNTPLVRIDRLAKQWGVKAQILVKIGYMNPGGSYKDRIGLQLIQDAEEAGHLKPGGTIIECTSGNTGMGLALAAVSRGYRCVFVMPDKMSREKIDALRALGAEVIVTPTAVDKDDPRSYYSVAARLNEEIPNSWHSNQYENQSNPRAHYNSTGPEIWRDTEGKITAFVNGMGTGGTLSGVGRYLKEQNPDVKIVGVDPIGSMYFDKFHSDTDVKPKTYLVEGIGEDFYPSTMDMSLVDDILQIDDKTCFTVARKLARREGIFSGGSTGAAVWGALEYAKRNNLGPDDIVVTMACDHGLRYLSKVFNEQWLRENEMLESEYELEARQLLGTKQGSGPRRLVSVPATASAADALSLLKDHDVSQIPVVDADDEPIGSLQEAQLVALFVEHKDLSSVKVKDVMGPPFPVVSGATPLEEVARQLTRENPAVLVEDEGSYGIVTKYDLIAHIAR
ncbi:MAG: cystathionine beta-synthase [Planctomycetes bacterium]|nr:cystathionine beta-synthase [Planctomycetota bacterium]